MSAELLPCPFCGGPARHLPFKAGFYAEAAICDACDVNMKPAAWNRRAALASQSVAVPAGKEPRHILTDAQLQAERRSAAEAAILKDNSDTVELANRAVADILACGQHLEDPAATAELIATYFYRGIPQCGFAAPQPPAVKGPTTTNARDTYAAMSPQARAAADLQMAVTEQALQNARASRDRRVTSTPVDVERRNGDRRNSGKE